MATPAQIELLRKALQKARDEYQLAPKMRPDMPVDDAARLREAFAARGRAEDAYNEAVAEARLGSLAGWTERDTKILKGVR